ncbi:MAG: hypothetical protein RIS76_3810 [Verrucomicrobiota bacterium]|jgi:uncharacterized RDD family membrane protein YckC
MPPSHTSLLRLRTPEGIAFDLPLAGPVSRLVAWMLDALIIALLCSVIGALFSAVGWLLPDLAAGVMLIAFFVSQFGYAILLEWRWRGQTLGKRLMRLRVVDATGHKLHLSQIVLRNLLRTVDVLPGSYLIGGLACCLTPRAQRLGDLAANTVVIREPRMEQPDLTQLLAGRFNSLRSRPHLCARLRQEVPPAEAAIALQALLRRDELDPVSRARLFAELATRFRDRVAFPEDLTEGLSDEQYVRAATDLLYGGPGGGDRR